MAGAALVVAKSLAQAAKRGQTVTHLHLKSSSDLRTPQVQAIDVSGNALETLPDTIGELQQLESLDVSDNSLSTLPVALTRLPRLSSIRATGNPLDGPWEPEVLEWLKTSCVQLDVAIPTQEGCDEGSCD